MIYTPEGIDLASKCPTPYPTQGALMNLRHGQLWQRLGVAVLSGILVASLAPATAAAPAGGQDTHSDAEAADLTLSSADSSVVTPAASQDRVASDGADASDEYQKRV